MTADICDLDELETGERREGLFGAIYWWMVKFGLAFAGLLSGFILGVIGFDQNVAVQSEETLAQLRMAFIGVPVSGTLIALWAMRNYELDETAVRDIKLSLSERQSMSRSQPRRVSSSGDAGTARLKRLSSLAPL